jgi:hypothetical protein
MHDSREGGGFRLRRGKPQYDAFAKYWHLSSQQARHFWTALGRSHAPQACGWRQQLALFEATHLGSSAHLIDQVPTPKVVMEVLECLIAEHLLGTVEGRRIEARVLDRVTAAGGWVG